MNYGFIKACAVSPALRVADCPYNAQETIEAMQQAAEDGCQLTVFPELGLTGYTCGDLFLQQPLLWRRYWLCVLCSAARNGRRCC